MSKNFPVIGIGASAGGLEPLEVFFEFAKVETNFAYILIQHLAPNHKSLMDELLARHTDLPIKVIEHDMPINKGKIYLNPPKKFVEIKDGKFCLIEKEDRKLSFPISSFLSSLAEYRHENACAIIFSGTGSDGSEGIKFIKEKGGLVLVQDPETAKFDGMPQNAIHTGSVDKICAVEDMHKELNTYFLSKEEINTTDFKSVSGRTLIGQILNSILDQINVDFTGYKYTTVSRRIARRMSLLGFASMKDYSSFLEDNAAESNLLAKELLIGVTRFFRDEEAFEILKNKIIPKLIEANQESKSLRVWVTACSTGEEAYSIAILIKDYLRVNRLQYDVSIFATDLDKESIKLAANRVFSENISAEIPPEYLNTYFIPQRNGYTIAKEIRDMIVFSAHNLIQDPPFNKIDLISCRNFLIYLNDKIQQQIFALFQYSLRTQGFLFLGSSETLGSSSQEFLEFDKKNKFYVNLENKKFTQHIRSSRTKNALSYQYSKSSANDIPAKTGHKKSRLLLEIQNSLIQEFVPDSIVTDKDFNLLHTTGNTNKWLRLPAGEISSNVLKMLPEVLAIPLEVVANKVIKSGNAIVLKSIEVTPELKEYFGAFSALDIHVRRTDLLDGEIYFFITFKPQKTRTETAPTTQIDMSAASMEKIHILERELNINRENLQTTIEELESSNEELQAANEELQSSNEELESVNEELYTVNAEFQQKNTELANANTDLNNIIHSTDIALLFLDSHLNIRKFTPAIKKIMNFVPHDIGRNISHFRGQVQFEDFLDKIENVYATAKPFQIEIKSIKEIDYLLKISPFKTAKGELKGVILVFIDISKINKMQNALELSDKSLNALSAKHYNQTEVLKLITDNLRDLVTIMSTNGEIEFCSASGSDITGYTLEEMYKLNFLNQIVETKHQEVWKDAIRKLENRENPGLIQFKFKTADGNVKWIESSLKRLDQSNSDSEDFKILVSTRDIHQRMLSDMEMGKLALVAEQNSNAVLITDVEGKISFANRAFEKMTEFRAEEVLGKVPGKLLQGAESDPAIIKSMSKAILKKNSFDVEIINYTKSKNKYLVRLQVDPMYDRENNCIGFFSTQTDTTKQRDQFNEIGKLNLKIKDQYKKLEEVNTALEEFAYIVSHDLKTPVRNISGLVDIIKKKDKELDLTKKEQIYDIISDSSKELSRMIDNLLEYSRTGTWKEDITTVDLSEILKEIIQLFKKELEELNGEITLDINVDKISVYPILFKRLITNLISNGIKYRGEQNPSILISIKPKSNHVLFEVKDNGMGIPEHQYNNIFNIFKSLNPNKNSNGIGLSVCKKIVEIHGGEIWPESEVGSGTSFFFTINNLI